MFNGPRVHGPAPEVFPDPNHDLGDGVPVAEVAVLVAGPSQPQGGLSTPRIPDVSIRKAGVILKYTYDKFLRIKFKEDSSCDEELECDTTADLLESFKDLALFLILLPPVQCYPDCF